MLEFENVINNVTTFHKVFDIIRIVDPVKKEVLYMRRNLDGTNDQHPSTELEKSTCYSFWSNGRVCDNCISMRALAEKDIFVKFEYAHSRIFITTVYPLEVPFTGYVVEIIKDVTSSQLVGNPDSLPLLDLYSNIETQNKELVTDALTGLFNKRYLLERLPYELVNNNLKGYDSALLMVDIDHLKNINDVFGHPAGDFILNRSSEILNECIREDYDWAARYTEETFAVYLKNIKRADLDQVCEKIQNRIETSVFNYERNIIPITVSIGASHLTSKVIKSCNEIIEFTENRLSDAKDKGQNTFVHGDIT